MPIEKLNLSTRAYQALKRAGVHTVEQLQAMSGEELLAIRFLGPRSLLEITDQLRGLGSEGVR